MQNNQKIQQSNVLKIALFATGLSGIVAEYSLSTLASYFLGDSLVQWTMTVSTMLFSMGLGSRVSRYIRKNLLEKLIFIEFLLSILTSLSTVLVYTVAGYSHYTGFFIYGLGILIGMLIGLEIPLVTRINEEYESLRENISAVMEKDYYGSLVGGVFFAFVGLQYLKMTYTPFVLGALNFLVAIWLYIKLQHYVQKTHKLSLNVALGITSVLLVLGAIFAEPIVLFGEQKRYKDKIIFSEQSKYQNITLTKWQEYYWLFINHHQQLSTLDEYLYHEPMVHSVMSLVPHAKNILIMGGGDGCAARELLKYPDIESITLVDLDPLMTDLAKNNEIFLEFNKNSMNSPKVKVINTDGYTFMEQNTAFYDVIIVDLPDPKNVDLNKLYTESFYGLCHRQLRPDGAFITQSGSPYYATKAFRCIEVTLQAAGFQTLPLHNQVLTLGEWGWTIGSKKLPSEKIKSILRQSKPQVPTRWLTAESMALITSFGKNLVDVGRVEVNTINNPVLYRYYLDGNWEYY